MLVLKEQLLRATFFLQMRHLLSHAHHERPRGLPPGIRIYLDQQLGTIALRA